MCFIHKTVKIVFLGRDFGEVRQHHYSNEGGIQTKCRVPRFASNFHQPVDQICRFYDSSLPCGASRILSIRVHKTRVEFRMQFDFFGLDFCCMLEGIQKG